MDKMEVNNQVITMRKFVKQAKVHVINRMTKEVKMLQNKKGNENQIPKYKRKAERMIEKIAILKKMNIDSVSKLALSKAKDWEAFLKEKNSSLQDQCLALLANHSSVQKEVEKFHSTHSSLVAKIPVIILEWENKSLKKNNSKNIKDLNKKEKKWPILKDASFPNNIKLTKKIGLPSGKKRLLPHLSSDEVDEKELHKTINQSEQILPIDTIVKSDINSTVCQDSDMEDAELEKNMNQLNQSIESEEEVAERTDDADSELEMDTNDDVQTESANVYENKKSVESENEDDDNKTAESENDDNETAESESDDNETAELENDDNETADTENEDDDNETAESENEDDEHVESQNIDDNDVSSDESVDSLKDDKAIYKSVGLKNNKLNRKSNLPSSKNISYNKSIKSSLDNCDAVKLDNSKLMKHNRINKTNQSAISELHNIYDESNNKNNQVTEQKFQNASTSIEENDTDSIFKILSSKCILTKNSKPKKTKPISSKSDNINDKLLKLSKKSGKNMSKNVPEPSMSHETDPFFITGGDVDENEELGNDSFFQRKRFNGKDKFNRRAPPKDSFRGKHHNNTNGPNRKQRRLLEFGGKNNFEKGNRFNNKSAARKDLGYKKNSKDSQFVEKKTFSRFENQQERKQTHFGNANTKHSNKINTTKSSFHQGGNKQADKIEKPLHPSWEAKKKLKEAAKTAFQGKRAVYD